MIPEGHDGLIVAEKSVSVSNLINGATRLQPVVMQLGQAAGALAALAASDDRMIREVGVREVQSVLLDAGCYLMPYLDLPKDHRHFKALQRIGATGILHGEGRNVGWENQTWFRAEDPLLSGDIYAEEYLGGHPALDEGPVTVGELMRTIGTLGGFKDASPQELWESSGLGVYSPDRVATRLEAAVMIDAAFNPFAMYDVGLDGNLKP